MNCNGRPISKTPKKRGQGMQLRARAPARSRDWEGPQCACAPAPPSATAAFPREWDVACPLLLLDFPSGFYPVVWGPACLPRGRTSPDGLNVPACACVRTWGYGGCPAGGAPPRTRAFIYMLTNSRPRCSSEAERCWCEEALGSVSSAAKMKIK